MIISFLIGAIIPVIQTGYAGLQDGAEVNVVTNCSGMQVVRVAPGRFEIRQVAPNTPGCVNKLAPATPAPVVTPTQATTASTGTMVATGVVTSTGTMSIQTGAVSTGSTVTNCNGMQVVSLSNGGYAISHVAPNLSGCVHTDNAGNVITGPDLSGGPLLDLASTDIVNYRLEQLKAQKIRFANAIRSVRMRAQASRESRTNAYLMRNDAVVVDGKETGWVKVQGADLTVTDANANTVEADTTGKADGYTASQYLRTPNTNDLVRIEQADHAYWSDVTRVGVRYANIRSNPWYTAPIVATLGKGYALYVIATVDNWSEVRNDAGTVRGYVRSDLLTIEKVQRVAK